MMNKLMNKVKGFVETLSIASANTGIQSAKLLFGNTLNNIGAIAKFSDIKVIVPLPWNAITDIDRYFSGKWENKWDSDWRNYTIAGSEIICTEKRNGKEICWKSRAKTIECKHTFNGIFVTVKLGLCVRSGRFECDLGNRTIFIPRENIIMHGRQLFSYVREQERKEKEAKTTVSMLRSM